MALQPCLTCQAMISRWAKRCPQCGEPQPHLTNQQKVVGVVLVLVVALGWFAFIQYKVAQTDEEMRNFRRQNGFPVGGR